VNDPELAARIDAVRARIAAAARRAGREPASVRLVGATKTVPAEVVRAALAAGLTDLGENRAQELVAKHAALAGVAPAPTWHFIGALQRNKVNSLAGIVTWWHTVDRLELGRSIARAAPGATVLVEVNVAGEAAKAGCRPADAEPLVAALSALGLQVVGLMTVPPATEDPRPWFARVRRLAQELGLRELSMGMSGDFEVAVEEGATMVRVGQALFGARPGSRVGA
jgi:pyridoxal phosphate enzyme (YggS family)